MAKPTYWELLRHPNWQRKRLEVLKREDFKCQVCGTEDQTLHVHHTYYEKGLAPWEYPDQSLKVVCEPCHERAQFALTELHRQMGRLEISEIDKLLGYAFGLELSGNSPVERFTVFSHSFALGLAAVFHVNGFVVTNLANSRGELSASRFFKLVTECDRIDEAWMAANKEPE